jgi:hypothetical protein
VIVLRDELQPRVTASIETPPPVSSEARVA